MIISIKRGIYELPHDLRLGCYEIKKYQENLKTTHNYRLVLGLPSRKKIWSILVQNSGRKEIELFTLCPISHEN